MNRLTLPLMNFPHRCDIYAGAPIPARTDRDGSGGRPADTSVPIAMSVPCSIQSATPQEIVNANVLGEKINTTVLFPANPGDLRTGARIVPTDYDGYPPESRPVTPGLSVCLTKFDEHPNLPIWAAYCWGRD